MAVVTFGLLGAAEAETETEPHSESFATSYDAFRFVAGEAIEALDARAHELYELLDQGLSVALAQLQSQV